MSIYNRVIGFLKSKLEKIDNNNVLRQNLLNAFPYWVGASVTGVIAIIYAYLFLLAEMGSAFIMSLADWVMFIVTPICFVIAWLLVKRYAPFARGSGIPQVSAAIDLSTPKHYHLVDKLLSVKVIIIKIASSLIMVFGGGVVGREGPTIQIAGSVFKKVNDLLPEWYPKVSKKNMIITGSAAGLAAAFNTPLGGIVFAIEELTKTHVSFFKSALLTGVIISGLTALHFLGPYLYLGFPNLDDLSGWVIFSVIFIGVLSGLAGSGMGKIVLKILSKIGKIRKNKGRLVIVVFFGLILATLAFFFNTHAIGSGKEIMQQTLFSDDKNLEWYVPLLRIAGTAVSFTVGAAGGIFAPSLSAGASIGAVYSDLLNLSNPDTNLIILCGMVGFLTGMTRSPFTSSILVLEMTDSHNIIFYLMLTGLLSYVVSNIIDKHSIYDHLKIQYMKEIRLYSKD